MGKLTLGMDLGGTKILAGLVDENHKVIAKVKRKTPSQDSAKAVVDEMVSCIHDLLTTSGKAPKDLSAIGIAIPGILDRKRGRVMQTPNLGMFDFPLAERFSKEFPVPLFLENDVNAGIYGEFVRGAAQGYQHILGVFPGTGIGGGLILNGKLYSGAGGNAGEFGHMVLQLDGARCGCGGFGHVEAMSSRTAMAKEAAALIAGGQISGPLAQFGSDIKNLSSKFFAEAVKVKEPLILSIIDRAARHLGVALAGSVNLLNPQLVVIGGGLVEKLGAYYLDRIEASLREQAMSFIVKDVKVKAATLGDEAGVIGAAALALETL